MLSHRSPGGNSDDENLLTVWPDAVFERCTMFALAAHHHTGRGKLAELCRTAASEPLDEGYRL